MKKGPAIQYRGNKLEFVYDTQQEKQLRFINESRKMLYKEAMHLQDEVLKRDSIISEHRIVDSKNTSIIDKKNEEIKLTKEKYNTTKTDNEKLVVRTEELKLEVQELKESKSKWKTYSIGLTAVIAGVLTGLILF